MGGGRSGSSNGDAGAGMDANALQAQANARIARLSEQGFQVDISNVIGIVGQQLQEFDVGMGRQMGATSLQLARSGAMSRDRRSIAYDETMGINKFNFQGNLETERDTLDNELRRLQGVHTTMQGNADYGLVEDAIAAAEELNHANPGQFTTPAPTRDDFDKVDQDRYRSASAAYQDCLKKEKQKEKDRQTQTDMDDARERALQGEGGVETAGGGTTVGTGGQVVGPQG